MPERDSTIETLTHMRRVQGLLSEFAIALLQRGQAHDQSKLGPLEKPYFDRLTPMPGGVEFSSPEYHAALLRLQDALEHHYRTNSHHPEHYPDGVAGMCLIDLVEMVADWKASSERRACGLGLEPAFHRFDIAPQLQAIIRNTASRHGWLDDPPNA